MPTSPTPSPSGTGPSDSSEITKTSPVTWVEMLPTLIGTLRLGKPLADTPEILEDLTSMALLADHYVTLVRAEHHSKWGDCSDHASQDGQHRTVDLCIFCGLAA